MKVIVVGLWGGVIIHDTLQMQEHLHRFGDWIRLECLSICFERVHVCMKVLPKAQPGDVLVFVFAGHGCQVRKLLHFRIALAWHGLHGLHFFNHFNMFNKFHMICTCFNASNVCIA